MWLTANQATGMGMFLVVDRELHVVSLNTSTENFSEIKINEFKNPLGT
jgi:hypothetical protein